MTSDYLKNKIKKLPPQSGIYVFKGRQKKHLYIGKAGNLKSRVLSYLKTDDIRIKKMVSLAKSLEHIATGSDIEALILESQLIKKFRPPFNIAMRDDKQYAFVGFTEEKYPKIFITHQPTKVQDFIGPFTEVGALKITLRYLRNIFPYCTCKQRHHNLCLNYHIGKCLGYCCLKNKSRVINIKNSHNLSIRLNYKNLVCNPSHKLNEYEKNLLAIKDVLTGKKKSVIKNLEKEMGQLAKKGGLEKAIELRDKLRKLKRVFENAKIIESWKFFRNSKLEIRNLETKSKKQNVLYGLKQQLNLDRLPVRIEGYDISNIQGSHATGSMVTFIHGQPDKNFYRKFKIKDLKLKNAGGNDTAMLKEVLERRFKHPEWPFPDLILIDGGKQQLRIAEAVVNPKSETLNPKQNSNIKIQNSKRIPVIALTKNKKHIGEKIYISKSKTPLLLTKLSPAYRNLFLTIDSEAHRFAIEYYRKLHRKLIAPPHPTKTA